MRILAVAAELFPYLKVGGLADVMAALPKALRRLGADARVMLPAFPEIRAALPGARPVWSHPDLLRRGPATVLLGETGDGVPLYALECPELFGEDGGPYGDWPRAHLRYGALGWAAAALARDGDGDGWTADILHAHDWPAGLAPAYLALAGGPRPRTLMTIHNIAYQGAFPPAVLGELWLPPEAYAVDGAEFNGSLSFLKAGLHYADRLGTVSPTYAEEIQHPAVGRGLEGLLAWRRGQLAGILNGVDTDLWDPATDPHLILPFDASTLSRRGLGKAALQMELGLQEDPIAPLFGVVSRLEEIKGLDLLLPNLEALLGQGAQFALLGSGDPVLEEAFRAAAKAHPGRVAARIGYDEGLAHRMFAGLDVLVVPSRSEPCGLTQMYALRYGCLPLVRETGGLADTVVDAADPLRGNGWLFGPEDPWELGLALARACQFYREDPAAWTALQRRAMAADHGWDNSARRYLDLFRSLVGDGGG
ncbi:MAG: glycogen synthase GlgA [Acidobacteria bacterium]|nr:glycogen synthase GlgA [Acidobacteriota bacterium]